MLRPRSNSVREEWPEQLEKTVRAKNLTSQAKESLQFKKKVHDLVDKNLENEAQFNKTL